MLNKITKEATLIIIDWDDTLLPSSAIYKENDYNNSIVFDMDFDEKTYDKCKNDINIELISFLKYIKTLGKVIIITSSRENWVMYSANTYLSCEVVALLKNIEIFYVDEVLDKWNLTNTLTENKKEIVFELIINEWIKLLEVENKTDNLLNIISLGDGYQELNAYYYITRKSALKDKNNLIFKHIKYLEYPTYNQLLLEYKLIKGALTNIINIPNNIYYRVTLH
jgi:hypothetical protein